MIKVSKAVGLKNLKHCLQELGLQATGTTDGTAGPMTDGRREQRCSGCGTEGTKGDNFCQLWPTYHGKVGISLSGGEPARDTSNRGRRHYECNRPLFT